MQDRNSAENQRWKREVRQRDGDACRACGVQHYIHVHHIKPFKKYPEFATELDNGITLCGNHHALLQGKEESTNLQTIIEAVSGQHDMRTADQLKRLSGKFCAYLDSLLKSSERFTRNKAVHQLFTHLQIYPDSLDQFLPLIRHLLNKENSRFNQGLVAQIAVEYLKGSSSGAALQVLREYEERFEAEEEERSELFPRAHQGDAEAQFRFGEMCATGKGGPRSSRAALKYYRDAALQGHVEAQFRVGNMYRSGTVVFNNSEANNWYRKAAEQDMPKHSTDLVKYMKIVMKIVVSDTSRTIAPSIRQRHSIGISKLQNKDIPKHSTNLAKCMKILKWMKILQSASETIVDPKTIRQRRLSGIEKLLKVAIPQPKPILTGCTKITGALNRYSLFHVNLLPLPNVHKMPSNRSTRSHLRTDQMCPSALALSTLKVSI